MIRWHQRQAAFQCLFFKNGCNHPNKQKIGLSYGSLSLKRRFDFFEKSIYNSYKILKIGDIDVNACKSTTFAGVF